MLLCDFFACGQDEKASLERVAAALVSALRAFCNHHFLGRLGTGTRARLCGVLRDVLACGDAEVVDDGAREMLAMMAREVGDSSNVVVPPPPAARSRAQSSSS